MLSVPIGLPSLARFDRPAAEKFVVALLPKLVLTMPEVWIELENLPPSSTRIH